MAHYNRLLYVVWLWRGWGYLGKDEFDEGRGNGMELVQGVIRIRHTATALLGVF